MTRYVSVWPLFGLCILLGCGGDDDASDSATPTATIALSATATMTATLEPTSTQQPAATRTSTPNPAGPTATATGVPTGTATASVTATATATGISAPSATPTATGTPDPAGPVVTFFGVTRADDTLQETDLFDERGRPIYQRLLGQGFSLIIEAGRGASGSLPGTEAYDPGGGAPDLQILVSRPLGDGSPEVCDYVLTDPSMTGGVPAAEPFEFSDEPSVVGAMNDLGCRVNDGTGLPRARVADENACTQMNGEFTFVDSQTRAQFCLPLALDWAFPVGDTIVAARVRNTFGVVSESQEIIIRVLRGPVDECGGLGERDFTIARPGSMLLSTAGSGDVSIDPWLEGTLKLCAGPELVDGVRPLRLIEDAVFGFTAADDSVYCVLLSGRDSAGTLDCGGGTAHDVQVVQEVPQPPISSIGLGDDAGPGAATLTTAVSILGLPAGSTAADCASLDPAGAGLTAALTTATTTGSLIRGDEEISLAAMGENFDCDRWNETDSPGTFVFAFTAPDTTVGDTVNALVLDD